MVATFILCCLIRRGDGHGKKAPVWLDRMLAGYALVHDESHEDIGVYDRKKGFFLIRSTECDGGNVNITLTRDRKEVSDAGYYVPGYDKDQSGEELELTHQPLPSLTTGKGITIGDSESKVLQTLGKPTKRARSGGRNQFLSFTYSWEEKTRESDHTYDEVYTFKAGKLIEVMFSREDNPD